MGTLRFPALLSALALLGACTSQPKPLPPSAATIAPSWPFASRARTVEASQAMVVSGNPIASAAGRDILQRGGNAIDAAVAVGFALAVVHPEAGNLGGGGFMLIRERNGAVRALDYRETAPGRATRTMYLDSTGQPTGRSITGHLAAAVPGSVAGLVEAHRALGKLPLAIVMAPAIRLAQDGFVVDSVRSRSIARDSARLGRFPASRAIFLPEGTAPGPGAVLHQPDLARTLRAIRDRGTAGFYQGWVASAIVEEMQRGGGLISHTDLAGYRPIWRTPVTLRYRDHTIYSMPPASSGGITMGQIFNVMEGYSSLPGFGSAALLHRESEAMRRAFADRNRYLGDPAFVANPTSRLLSKEYAASLRRQIGPRATPSAPSTRRTPDGVSTTHYSVVDREGNSVSTTTTLNNAYGSAVTVTGAGFLLNDEMDDFATNPGQPNMYGLVQSEASAIAPGKRMLSSMTPSIVIDPQGALYMLLGTPGGPRIITTVYQVISNVVDHGMSLADAVSAPRLHHQGLPDSLYIEERGFSETTLDSLRMLGHAIATRPSWGDVEAIIRTANGWQGVSDPRYGGGGAGY